jgi:hypothetical protein
MVSSGSGAAEWGAGEGHEGSVDVIADLPAGAQAPEPVEQRDGLFDDVALLAEAGSVGGGAAADDFGECDSSAAGFVEDLLGGGGPYEWLRVVVGGLQVLLDRGGQVAIMRLSGIDRPRWMLRKCIPWLSRR